MILPSSYAVTLALIIFGMLSWGLWASLFKATGGKTRFELFYFDFAIGTVVAALLCALTLGTLGFDGFSFFDDLLHAAKKQDLVAIAAGAVFCLGNLLLLAGIAETGLSVAFPVGAGVGIVVGAIWQFFLKPGQNLGLVVAGSVAIFFGIVVCSSAYRIYKLAEVDELVRTGQQKSTRRRVNSKGLSLAIVGGFILGSYFPLISQAMEGEVGVGPYSTAVLFAVGIAFSTFLYNLFFMNLPVSGPPLEIFDFFKLTGREHILGVAAGALWILGLTAQLVAGAAEGANVVNPAVSWGCFQGSVVIAAILGLLLWKEYPKADGRVRSLMFIMLALLVGGIGMIALAPFGFRG